MTAEEMQSNLHDQFAALAHKHATVSYAVLFVLGLVLILGAVGGYIGLKSYEGQLAKAQLQEMQYNQDRKAWEEELQVRAAAREAEALKVEQLLAQIAARPSQPLPKPIQTGLKPDATIPEIGFGLDLAFKGLPGFQTPVIPFGPYVQLTGQQAQTVTQSKVDLDREKLDNRDLTLAITVEKSTISSLNTDLTTCKTTLSEADKVIAGYKKVAKKTKWQKFLGGAKTALLMAGSAYIGHKL